MTPDVRLGLRDWRSGCFCHANNIDLINEPLKTKSSVQRTILGKISTQPHTIVKQICFPNGNVLFLSLFSLSRNWIVSTKTRNDLTDHQKPPTCYTTYHLACICHGSCDKCPWVPGGRPLGMAADTRITRTECII